MTRLLPSLSNLRVAPLLRTRCLRFTLCLTWLSLGLIGCGLTPNATQEGATAQSQPVERFGLGRSVTADEIKAWDIDVMPDGTGLPPGKGSVSEGAAVYASKCARCHGATGTEGPFDRLVGRIEGDAFPFATDPTIKKTIGNYWPYASTLFDYTRRAMPLDRPGSLSDDEVYALTAYLLFRNDLIQEDAILDAASLPLVEMPSRSRFFPDDRRGGLEIR